jgi:DNA invertase Pin-like site-specific DNA recombinase
MSPANGNNVCLFLRISTDKQTCARQLTELKTYCDQTGYTVSKIISTTISGTKTDKNRPDIIELLESARRREFQKVLVTEISRLGRNARDLRNTIDQLHRMKIPVIFKNLGNMESLDDSGNETFVTNVIIAIWSELGAEEARILSMRVKSGIEHARQSGKVIGRAKGSVKSSDQLLKEYSRLVTDLKNGFSLNKCVKLHDVSKNTVIKVKRAIIS